MLVIRLLVRFLNCFENEGSLFHHLSGRQQVLELTNQQPVLETQEEGGVSGVGGVCFTLLLGLAGESVGLQKLGFVPWVVSFPLPLLLLLSPCGGCCRLVCCRCCLTVCIVVPLVSARPWPGHSRLNIGSFVWKC